MKSNGNNPDNNSNNRDNNNAPEEISMDILTKLPAEMLMYIVKNIPVEQWDILSRVNRTLFSIFLPDSIKITKQLLTHVVRGEKEQAEEIIKLNPYLLLNKAIVTDYSGRKIRGTAWQIAAGAEDVCINARDKDAENETKSEEMLEMIERYLKQLPNGNTALAKQKTEQFPENWEKSEAARAEADSRALRDVFDAIAAGKDCESALATFEDQLKAKGIIEHGKHFNTQLLAEALELGEENFEKFGRWFSPKNNLVMRVIGIIQFYLPACFAQAICTGLTHAVDEKEPLKRSLFVDNKSDPSSFYYYRGVSQDFGETKKVGLGYSYAIFSDFESAFMPGAGGPAINLDLVDDYLALKEEALSGKLNPEISNTQHNNNNAPNNNS